MAAPADGLTTNYRFADLALDVTRRCVTRQGLSIELKALDFDLLRFLVESAPNVVNADVLAEKVWGRHFVSPENVAQRVMLLRQSLSDDANRPRYIETVRNKGYRLVPVVEKLPAQAAGAAPQRRGWLVPATAAALLLSVGVAAVAAYWLDEKAELPVSGPRSVAILSFENLSPDPDDAYFAAGMQDEIVSQLTKIRGLRVIPVQPASDVQTLIADAAHDLNIVATLGGSVYYSEGRVRVTPRLTQAATGVSLWSNSYERELSDIFAIQSEIALDVARALRLELTDTERERIERVPTVDPRARDLYLKARVLESRATPADLLRAIAEVEEALRIQPDFTEAWVVAANARNVAQYFDPGHAAEHRALGERAARQAVTLDPESSNAHAALGLALVMQRDWRGGEAAFRKARTLAPYGSSYCMLQLAAGKFAAARDLIEAARGVQPQDQTIHRFLMFAYSALGEWATATELYESGTELFKPWREAANNRIHWLVGHGELAAARAITANDQFNAETLASLDPPTEAIEKLRRAYAASGPGNPNHRLYIGLWAGHFGDAELALEVMRATIDEQGGLMIYIWLPQLAEMRRLPEFNAYLREIGMVDYWQEYGWPDICRRLDDGAHDFECD